MPEGRQLQGIPPAGAGPTPAGSETGLWQPLCHNWLLAIGYELLLEPSRADDCEELLWTLFFELVL